MLLITPFKLLFEEVRWVGLLRYGGGLTDHGLVQLQLLLLDLCVLLYEVVQAQFFAADVDHDVRTGGDDCDLLGSISVVVLVVSAEHFDYLVLVGQVVQEFCYCLICFVALHSFVLLLFLTLRVRQFRLVHFLSEGFNLLLGLMELFESLERRLISLFQLFVDLLDVLIRLLDSLPNLVLALHIHDVQVFFLIEIPERAQRQFKERYPRLKIEVLLDQTLDLVVLVIILFPNLKVLLAS